MLSEAKRCVICEHLELAVQNPGQGKIRRVLVEDRVLLLCDAHAGPTRSGQVASLEQLRRLFVESEGRRSLLERRDQLDRRGFPPRPEGRRTSRGRRATDHG